MSRKMRMGMVGGGRDAFIGGVHRMAAALDGEIELVCGAFSSNPEKSRLSGEDLYLPAERVYASFQEMILAEKELPAGERMDFMAIVTPNFLHFEPAKMALENGFPVMCEKPMTFNLEEAKELKKIVDESGLLFGLTHNYTGYPMVKQARDMVKDGIIGKIRKVVVEYPQGWLATRIESDDQKQAAWRVDPKRAGSSCCMGDIGSHAENLAEFITGLKITELCADLTTFAPGRELEDDGNVLLRLEGGAKGILHASQISVGCENDLNIRIYGEKGGLEWKQTEPNSLTVKWLDRPMEILRAGTGMSCFSEGNLAHTRLPAGHPEGYLEAFACLYRNFAQALRARIEGTEVAEVNMDFPDVNDGVRGMAFIETVVASSKTDSKWTKMKN